MNIFGFDFGDFSKNISNMNIGALTQADGFKSSASTTSEAKPNEAVAVLEGLGIPLGLLALAGAGVTFAIKNGALRGL